MKLNGKRVSLDRLRAELATAGIAVPALGVTDDDLHTYDAAGASIALPPAAGPVVTAHTATPVADYGADAEPIDPETIRAVVTAFRAYLALSPPTNADVVQQVRRLTRVQLALLRSVAGTGG